MSEEKTLAAVIQFGVMGFIMGTDIVLEVNTIDELIKKISDETEEHKQALLQAQDEDGDLRHFVPSLADGYPSFGDIGIEFGEDFNCCLLDLKLNGNKIGYNDGDHKKIRSETGLY